jgi:hypothetical protein
MALVLAAVPAVSLAQQELEIDDVAASSYATENGVSMDEAKKRLKVQAEIQEEDVLGLRREFDTRLAGLYLDHQPDQHMVVRLVGSSPVSPRVIRTSQGDLRVVFHVDQKHTHAELQNTVSEFITELSSIPGIQGIGVDERTGEIVLDIAAPESEEAAYEKRKDQLEQVLGAPIRFQISRSPLVPLANEVDTARQ